MTLEIQTKSRPVGLRTDPRHLDQVTGSSLIEMGEFEGTCTKRNGLLHAKSLRIDLILSLFCQGCRANPLIQLMAHVDSAGHAPCAHFGIRHFSGGKRVRASQAFAHLRCGRVANKGAHVKGFPTLQEVENADKEQLARWYRFLPSGENAADQKIMKRIAERFEKLGGMTAELSKKIGM
jgi:hypothetical protein